MKNKIIFVIIFIAVLSAGIAGMFFLTKKGSLGALTAGLGLEPAVKPEQPAAQQPEKEVPASVLNEVSEEALTATLVETDYFSLIAPFGWDVKSDVNTLPVIIFDIQDKITNDKAKEIDFHTNLSINSASLGELSLKDYVEKVKNDLINAIPIIEIIKEEPTVISGNEAYLLEIKSVQQDLRFSTLLSLVMGKKNTIWAFSFNTLEETWPDYKSLFIQTARSVQMK